MCRVQEPSKGHPSVEFVDELDSVHDFAHVAWSAGSGSKFPHFSTAAGYTKRSNEFDTLAGARKKRAPMSIPLPAVRRRGRAGHIPGQQGETTMRFMVMVKSDAKSEAGVLPDEKMLSAMGKYNEELIKAGVMLAGEGLQPSSKGKRVRASGP